MEGTMNLEAFNKLQYGVYIVTAGHGDDHGGQVANCVVQLTANPILMGISINKENHTHSLIEKSKKLGVSIMDIETPFSFIGPFGFRSGRDFKKLENAEHLITGNDVPIVTQHANAWFEGNVINTVDLGTHSLFIVDVIEAATLSNKKSMTYAYYHEVLKGKTHKNAPTFREK